MRSRNVSCRKCFKNIWFSFFYLFFGILEAGQKRRFGQLSSPHDNCLVEYGDVCHENAVERTQKSVGEVNVWSRLDVDIVPKRQKVPDKVQGLLVMDSLGANEANVQVKSFLETLGLSPHQSEHGNENGGSN